MKFFKSLAVVTAIALSAVNAATSAHAFGLNSVMGGGDSKGGSSVDVGALVTEGSGLMGRFNSAFGNMNIALARTMDALGYKEDAQKLEATGSFYLSGNVADEDQVERDIEMSAKAQEKAAEKMSASEKLTEEGKKHLAAAAPHYGKGIVETTQLVPEFQSWSASVTSGLSALQTDPMGLAKLKDETTAPFYVATNLPSLLATFSDTTSNFVKFARSNDLEVPSDLSASF